jgi:hypothetical protein
MMRSRLVVLTVIAAALLSVAAPASAQTAPSLGAAQSFAVLSGTASVTNTGPSSLSGDLGTSGVAGITGFPPGTMTGALHNGDSVAAQAQLDAITAPTSALINLQGQACTASFGATIIGVGTLIPGVYCYTSTLGLTGTLTLDAQNNPGAVFIIKVGSSLTAGVGSIVQLINGAQPCNVFWAVTTDATVGVGASFAGNLLVGRDISASTGARLSGRALAGRAVTLDTNTVEATVCSGGGSTVPCATSTSAPTITTIPNQVIPPVPVAGSVSVGFTISGAIITDALIVSATSSDSTLVPASAMVITRGVGGARVLTIRGADGRSGITTITVTVTDPSVTNCVRATSTSFRLTIGAVAVPTLSQWAYVLLMVLLTGGGMLAVRRRAFASARRAPLD